MLSVRGAVTTLDVILPRELGVANRAALIDAVAAGLVPGIGRVRLHAGGVGMIDMAGLGALARVLRLSMDATGAPPQLVGPEEWLLDTLRAVLLLCHFDVRRGGDPARGGPRADEAG